MAHTPTYVWTTSAEGKTIGHRIDYGTEERLGFLAEFCNLQHAETGLDQVYDIMEQLVAKWPPEMVGLWHTPELVREMAALDRFVVGRGARIRLLVFEKLLDALPYARAHHWKNLIDLPESTPGWQQRNGQKFFEGLRTYMNGGWRDDLDNCEDLNDKKRLVENLSELAQRKTRSRFFTTPLREVHDEISTIADEEEQPEIGTGLPNQALLQSSLNESEVRSMFQTLLLDGS